MRKARKCNKGFSLIELLIAITILSIVMIMVVQFMGTTSAAYRKTKKNLNIQTEAMTVLEQISDTIMQARYVRVVAKDSGVYTISKDDASGKNERVITTIAASEPITFDFVPDNYANYSEKLDLNADDKEVIVNFDNFKIVDKTNNPYPQTSDADIGAGTDVRSFRMLKTGDQYNYIKPEYIYTEHVKKDGSNEVIVHTIYYITDITDTEDNTCSIYVYRYEKPVVGGKYTTAGFDFVRAQLTLHSSLSSTPDGLLSDNVADFYLSADAEGNSFLTNILFKDEGYEYNTAETINFRNSNVLTVRPQNLFKVKGTGYNVNIPEATESATTQTTGGSGGTTPTTP